MRVFGIAGPSGSGKTTLIEKLLPVLAEAGLTVSTIKQANPKFDMDQPGKDSWRHRQAGAAEVMVASDARWVLQRTLPQGAPLPGLDELLAHMSPVDLVIVEGFRDWPHDRLLVFRPEVDKPLTLDERVVAVAATVALPNVKVPVLDLDDAGAVARFILGHLGR